MSTAQAAEQVQGIAEDSAATDDAGGLVWPEQWKTASREGTLLGRMPLRWDLEHEQAGQIVGNVLHIRTREGVPDAKVKVYAAETTQVVAETVTDKEGHYRLPMLDPNKYEFAVEKSTSASVSMPSCWCSTLCSP